MKITKKFSSICSYQGNNFTKWFGKMNYIETSVPLHSKKLPRNMTYTEILENLKPTEVTLGDVYTHLETASHNDWMLFYVKDTEGVLRMVDVRWYGVGWGVFAFSVGSSYGWNVGYRVFSRNPFDTLTSDPQTLKPFDPSEMEITYKGEKFKLTKI